MIRLNCRSLKLAIERKDAPTALVFSRQNLAQQERSAEQVANIAKGGYILKDCQGQPELILIATGSGQSLQLMRRAKRARYTSTRGVYAIDRCL